MGNYNCFEDYREQVRIDAVEAIECNYAYCSDFDEMMESLQLDDSVTGNASGSYTFSTYQAEENIKGIIFDDKINQYFNDYGYNGIPLDQGAEAIDVIIRCFALDSLYSELEDYFNEIKIERTRWACPDCSNELNGVYIELEKSNTDDETVFVCPKCGCITTSPIDDACLKMD